MFKRVPIPRTKLPPVRAMERWLGLLWLLGAAVLATTTSLVHDASSKAVEASHRVSTSYRLTIELDQLMSALQEAEVAQRGHLLLGKTASLEPYRDARVQVLLHLKALRPLTWQDSEQGASLDRLEPLVTKRFDYLAQILQLRDDRGFDAARKQMETDDGSSTLAPIRNVLAVMQGREQTRLNAALAQQSDAADHALLILVTAAGILTLLSLGFWVVIRREFDARKRLEKTLHETTTVDDTTGAVNRREFERLLDQEWAFRMRYRTPLSMLVIDADDFKRINEAWGHVAGDAVLRELARRLQARLRNTERLARFAGDSFCLLVPQPLGAAMTLASQLIELVAQDPYLIPPHLIGHSSSASQPPKMVRLTVSIGVADASDVDSARTLVEASDAALHVATARGAGSAEAYRIPPVDGGIAKQPRLVLHDVG